MIAEYQNLDGLAIADLIRHKEISPREAVMSAINRIEASAEGFVVHTVNDTAHLQQGSGQDG